jgi:AcrR family transcriptional regulator
LTTEKTPSGRKRSNRKKGVERRQTIIDAARKKLIESGLSGLVMRDLAESLGITHGNVQYYFSTKDDLLVAIFEQEVKRYTESMHDAIELATSRTARISIIFDSAIEEIRSESTSLWMMLHSLARQSESLRVILADANQLYDETLAENLTLIDPGLSPERRYHIAQIIRIMIDGLSVQSIYDDLLSPEMLALQGELKATVASLFNIS